jgi:hypothetical protein
MIHHGGRACVEAGDSPARMEVYVSFHLQWPPLRGRVARGHTVHTTSADNHGIRLDLHQHFR